jgi:hypothetical protein
MSKFRLPSMARHGSLLAVVVVALVLASSAMAAPSVNTYGGSGGQTQGQLGDTVSGDPSGTASASGSGGSLPFTGLDLALMLGGGLVLVAVGASLARLSPRSN